MRRLYVLLLTGLMLVVTATGLRPAFGSVGSDGHIRATAIVKAPAADSPSPTLGSTAQPGVNPPGDNDADANDFTQAPLVVIAFLILVLIGGAILLYISRRGRSTGDHTPQHRRPDEPRD